MGLCQSLEEIDQTKRTDRGGGNLKSWRNASQRVAPMRLTDDKATENSNENNETTTVVKHSVTRSASFDPPQQSRTTNSSAIAQTVPGEAPQMKHTDTGIDGNGKGVVITTGPSMMTDLLPGEVPTNKSPALPKGTISHSEFTEEEFKASFSTLVGSTALAYFPWSSKEDQPMLYAIPPTSAGEVLRPSASYGHSRSVNSNSPTSFMPPLRRISIPMGNSLPRRSGDGLPESMLSRPSLSLRKCLSDPQTATRIRWAKGVGISPRSARLPASPASPELGSKSSSGRFTATSTKSSSSDAVQNSHFIPNTILTYPRNNVSSAGGGEVPKSTSSHANPASRYPGKKGFTIERDLNLPGLPEFETLLKRIMILTNFQAGEWIIRKNAIGREMYFLIRGSVEVISSSGDEFYETISEGSFFGELGVLFNVPRTASVRASTTCHCWMLTRERLDQLLELFPQIAQRFKVVAEERMQKIMSRKSSQMKKAGQAALAAQMKPVQEEPEENG